MQAGWLPHILVLVALLPAAAPAQTTRPLVPRWSAADWVGVPEVEQALFDFTNDERRRRKLAELQPLAPLTTAARQHSAEMLAENYFSHDSPHAEWATPSLRAWHAGLWEGQAAENIAMMVTRGMTVSLDQLAHEFMYGEHGWMNSPGHKANILMDKYTHLGLGLAIRDGRYYATQLFATPSYEFSELKLTRTQHEFIVGGKVKVLASTSKLWRACDKVMQGSFPVQRGKTYPFILTAPADGETHRLGLHPAIDDRSFWIKFLFYLDTGQPLDEALVLPYE